LKASDRPRDKEIFCIVDLHAITMPQNPDVLRHNIRTMAASLIACGVDPLKCILFQQSSVKEHTELAWILGTLISLPRLGSLAQYKEKAARLKEIPLGLYTYPVLQSADILLYKATDVPVGEDNVQNVQIAQFMAQKFNSTYSQYFPRPKIVLAEDNTARLRSLRNPDKKMSKSDPDSKSCIYVDDSPEDIEAKVKKCVTDTIKELEYDPANRPGVANLILIHSALTGESSESIGASLKENGTNKVQYKKTVTEVLVENLAPIRNEMSRILDDKHYLDNVLEQGNTAAREIAEQTIKDVKHIVGFN